MISLRKLKKNLAGAQMVPLVLAVVITFAVLFIGIFVMGEINQSLIDTYPAAGHRNTSPTRTMLQNTSCERMDNISENFDSTQDIVQVVIIITILASAIAAIFLFTRFR